MAVAAPTRRSWRDIPPGPASDGKKGKKLQVARLGMLDYLAAWELQRRLTGARREQEVPDLLLLLEHPHTYTLGRSGHREHILLSSAQLRRRGIAVYDVDRGGDVTYHGPGQLVGYPILKLPHDRFTFVRYIRDLERALLLAVQDLGVAGELKEGLSGVWVGDEKLCAIGVKVDAGGVTSHGFALNINPDLSYFAHIIPCGIRDKGVTSLEAVLGRRVSMRRVERAVIDRVAEGFELDVTSRAVGLRRIEALAT